jgi:hypothetical protein
MNLNIIKKLGFKKVLFILTFFTFTAAFAQNQTPPTPVEFMVGHKRLDFQIVFKKKFAPESKFDLLAISVFSENYDQDVKLGNSIIIPIQVNYSIGKKGFALSGGVEANSVAGVNPFTGVAHTFANRKFLAISVLNFFINEGQDLKLFGLYEFKPPINEKWSMYSRVQFVYNHSLADDHHNRSFLYLRAGLKKGPLGFGLGANWDQYGTNRISRNNFGVFTRWEF